jgi:hypothetical protein
MTYAARMPRNELRTSGLLQAAIVALVLGALFRRVPPGAATATWPYVLAGYGALAATVPWASGGLDRGEFSARYSLLLGVFFALPMAAGAWWLLPTAYRAIGLGAAVFAGAWVLHLVVSLAWALAEKRRRKGGAP